MNSPEFTAKLVEGPVGILTIKPSGSVGMGKALVHWFIYTLAVSAMVAYVASPLSSGTTGAALRVDGGVTKSVF